MSSYLTFYGVDRKDPNNIIDIVSFCRSSRIYGSIMDAMHVAYIDSDEKYSDITTEDIERAQKDLKDTILKYSERMTMYEKYAATNPDYIEDILDLKEEIDDLKWSNNMLDFLWQIVYNVKYGGNTFSKIICNVD